MNGTERKNGYDANRPESGVEGQSHGLGTVERFTLALSFVALAVAIVSLVYVCRASDEVTRLVGQRYQSATYEYTATGGQSDATNRTNLQLMKCPAELAEEFYSTREPQYGVFKVDVTERCGGDVSKADIPETISPYFYTIAERLVVESVDKEADGRVIATIGVHNPVPWELVDSWYDTEDPVASELVSAWESKHGVG